VMCAYGFLKYVSWYNDLTIPDEEITSFFWKMLPMYIFPRVKNCLKYIRS
jgi:hypothetical protein